MDDLGVLLFEVAFAGIVGGPELDASLRTVVADRSAAVQAAWIESVGRMIASPGRW